MTTVFSDWRPLSLTDLATLPESPGVFEVATLVRSVVLIGAATESLAATLAYYLDMPGQMHQYVGRLYFRYAAHEEPARACDELLAAYRARHGGAQPPCQATPAPTSRAARHLKAV